MQKPPSQGRGQERRKGLFIWLRKNAAVLALIIATSTFILHNYEISNLQKLNKQHLDPKVSFMAFRKDDGTITMLVRNIGILPATEVYVKRNIYYCSKDGKEIEFATLESPGWHIKELPPADIQMTDVKKEFIIGKAIGEEQEAVFEFCVEYYRQSDLRKYSFREMYFFKDSNLLPSEDGRIRDDPYYKNFFKLISNYEPGKYPTFEDLGKYKVDSK
ncbi:MAG: hypothetical protein PHW54_01515 [Candidatus Omnitrophica bacterium]|nr:hypothetical protein [Candidatus Omnitrophota bacterium]